MYFILLQEKRGGGGGGVDIKGNVIQLHDKSSLYLEKNILKCN